MKPRLSTWTHPKTGEVRVYVNHLTDLASEKYWFERDRNSADPEMFVLQYRGGAVAMRNENRRMREAEAILAAMGLNINTVTWSELVERGAVK